MKKILLMMAALLAAGALNAQELPVLHVNDTHSHIDPQRSGEYVGRGGVIEQAAFVDSVRCAEGRRNVLLLHAGDYGQGTSYFTELGGNIEIDVMNSLGFDVVCLGNHEFDNGIKELARRLKNLKADVVCANYDVKDTPLEGIVQPYTIIKRCGLRIGILGIGVNPTSLIAEKNFAPIQYLDPITSAQTIADKLKNQLHCDLVICLSHQGTHPGAHGQMSDMELAAKTQNIDVIIGAHTHKIVENLYVTNLKGDSVLLTQTGKAGARIGEISLKIGQ
jgi:5'-nucleotidase